VIATSSFPHEVTEVELAEGLPNLGWQDFMQIYKLQVYVAYIPYDPIILIHRHLALSTCILCLWFHILRFPFQRRSL
jgi:hypothetical protein